MDDTENAKSTKPKPYPKCSPINTHRWQWWSGAAAVSLVTVSDVHAGDVTVPLIGNYISATGGVHLNVDLTGDGVPSFVATGVLAQSRLNVGTGFSHRTAQAVVDGVYLLRAHTIGAFTDSGSEAGYIANSPRGFRIGSTEQEWGTSTRVFPRSVTGAIPIVFNDPLINGGAVTPAELEVTASVGAGYAEIQLDSYTYDQTSSSVPDQTSTLALLALGAGGVLAFRQRRQAA